MKKLAAVINNRHFICLFDLFNKYTCFQIKSSKQLTPVAVQESVLDLQLLELLLSFPCSMFARGMGTPPPVIDSKTNRKLLRRSVAAVCAHAGYDSKCNRNGLTDVVVKMSSTSCSYFRLCWICAGDLDWHWPWVFTADDSLTSACSGQWSHAWWHRLPGGFFKFLYYLLERGPSRNQLPQLLYVPYMTKISNV